MTPNPMKGPEWFTVPQMARVLGVSRQTIYDAVQDGRVQARGDGWSRRINGEEILKYALRTGRNIQSVAERMRDEKDNEISWKQLGAWVIAIAGLAWLLRKMDE
jgi:excisionase family DNA binding protein